MACPPNDQMALSMARTRAITLRCPFCFSFVRAFLVGLRLLKSLALDHDVHSGANIVNNGKCNSTATIIDANVTSHNKS